MSKRKAREARRAATKHRGLHYKRVTVDLSTRGVTLEAAFALEWEKENLPNASLGGRNVLQSLMYGWWDRNRVCHIKQPYGGWTGWAKFIISRRDAAIAATVVQWLGTNVGRAFLESALRRAGYGLLYPHDTDAVARAAAHRERTRQQVEDNRAQVQAATTSVREAMELLDMATTRLRQTAAKL